jgi:DNA-binding response OmpR family regulator
MTTVPCGIKVLVTDDDADTLLLTTMLLKGEGYEVYEANNAEQCLALAKELRPDMVLLDVMLPDKKGTEVCKIIKSNPDLQSTFVVLVSGILVSSDYQAEGLNVGADGYMIKPMTNREFIARIHSMVRIKKAETALREKEVEQQRLIEQLQEALAEIKTLKGFIPICASCKKIRDDEGYWNQIEEYLTAHTDAVFTHGLCPQCVEKYTQDIEKYVP